MDSAGSGGLSRRLGECADVDDALNVLARAAARLAPGSGAVATVYDESRRRWHAGLAGHDAGKRATRLLARWQALGATPSDLEPLANQIGLRALQADLPLGDGRGALILLRPEKGPATGGGDATGGGAAGAASGGETELALADMAALGALALRALTCDAHLERLRQEQHEQQRFLSLAAHDLRTPLAAIRGYAQLLLRQRQAEVTPQQRSGLTTIIQQSDRLAALTETVLDVARVQTGRMTLRRGSADLGQIVREAAGALAGSPGQPAVRLSLPEQGPQLQADAQRLGQITRSMLEFAAGRAGGAGSLDVHLAPEEGGVRLSVADPGPVLPEGAGEVLFYRLVEQEGEVSSPMLGHLGLYIARGAAEAHGGRAWADSPVPETDRGLRLSVWLPLDG